MATCDDPGVKSAQTRPLACTNSINVTIPCLERGKRAGIVVAHEPREIHHVGSEYGYEATLD